MYGTRTKTPPREVFEGLFVACIILGVLAGIVYGFRLYNNIVSK
ncbi:MAG: hypothetical protein OEW62_06105 [Candidatus Bathyarchaeota archaeon]|nr:hypothetical protein [Candidatus Bathyarchaeota archaeon]MDH5746370.1 hypothetical protein [Candidatus Bathyarchaeota archaeon]